MRFNELSVNQRLIWTIPEAATWIATGDATKEDRYTLSDYSENERFEGEGRGIADAWNLLCEKLAGGELFASSSTCNRISPEFWMHALLRIELRDGHPRDVFRRGSEEHRDVMVKVSDVKAAFPPEEILGESAVLKRAMRPPQVSDAELRKVFQTEFISLRPSYECTRDNIVGWGKNKFGDRITEQRLILLYREVAPFGGQTRGRGRRTPSAGAGTANESG